MDVDFESLFSYLMWKSWKENPEVTVGTDVAANDASFESNNSFRVIQAYDMISFSMLADLIVISKS